MSSIRTRYGAEVAITLVFGFIHGFGFAGKLQELSLRQADIIVPLLSFNVGLEAAQLLALALVAAPILVIARSRAASTAVAVVVGLVAISWIAERGFDARNPLAGAVGRLMASPERMALIMFGLAAVTLTALGWKGGRTATGVPCANG